MPAAADPQVLAEEKQRLRRRMRALRLVVDQKDGADAALAMARHGLAGADRLGVKPGAVVAGYWPIATEIDVRPLLARLDERGVTCALPVVMAADAPLVFRRWRPEDALAEGVYGTRHPLPDVAEVVPDVILAPLLAVDHDGLRLGHGGGFYDRTLTTLRARRTVTVVGVGYAIQLIDRVPHGPGDQRVDWILTDAGLSPTGDRA